VLAAHAEELLAAVERAEGDLAAAAAGAVAGVVRVGSFQTASMHLVLPAMTELERSHPGVEVRLVESEPEPALEALRSHQLDLVLADEWTGAPRPRLPGLDREDLFQERVEIAVAAHHPAAQDDPVDLADLAKASWAAGDPGGGMHELVRRVCNGHGGFEPHIRHHTNELGMLLALVEHGQAVTLLPEIALADAPDGVAARPIAGAQLARTVFTAARTGADRRPALAAVRDALRAAAATRPGVRASAGP
jgi:DNA-binding transcriptional LysR family regulator